ncbi:hypothetical protein [Klebsiella pneumoniae]|uniref:hypothetical protein n=1 Tax=Klebsiella pneumoniae TaxID=573 RepID=UPI0025509C4F|nr:hypothetical protein [Klebsiella pneumoniae]MDK6239553.1 hypothetical protein [Klebsiella pneumoniae]
MTDQHARTLTPAELAEQRAAAELKALLETRIAAGLAGKVSGKTIAEIVNDELAEPEARR